MAALLSPSMAAPLSLRPFTTLPLRRPLPPTPLRRPAITCGPRDNRGPLVRGRTLSTEAILAVQALKRAASDDANVDRIVSTSVLRLVKPDLLACLAELQRQDQWRLALKVFVTVRREFWYSTDFSLYAEMVAALARNGMGAEIDLLVGDLLEEGEKGAIFKEGGDVRGLARVLKALIAAGRGEAVKRMYWAMERGGYVGDEYLFRVLSRGLRRLGEAEVADEVERNCSIWLDG